MANFIDGSEFILINLMNPMLKTEWNLDIVYIEYISSVFALGLFFGTISSAYISDRLGRRPTMIISTIFQFGVILFVVFLANDIYKMILARFWSGYTLGITLPLSYVIISEIMPLHIRGRANIVPVAFELTGMAFIILVGLFYMESLEKGNWRAMILCQSVPCLIVCIGNIFILKESPRYLLSINKTEEAIEIINQIGFINNTLYKPLNQSQIEKLIIWQQQAFKKHDSQQKATLSDLYNKENYKITPKLWCIGFIMNFVAFSIMFLLPFILIGLKFGLVEFGISQLGQGLALIPVYFAIDKPGIGRRKSLYWSYLILFFIYLSGFIYQDSTFTVFVVTVSKFFIRICYQNSNVLVVESYSTPYRSLGAGYYYGIQKIGGALSPFGIQIFYNINPFLPFLVCSLLCIPLFLLSYFYPIDLTNKQMDGHELESDIDSDDLYDNQEECDDLLFQEKQQIQEKEE